MAVAAEDMRRRSNRWRATVALAFQAIGFPAESRPAARRASGEVFGNEPDVFGVPGLHIKASPIGWAKVSVYLNQAVQTADERGQGDVPVLVIPRQQYDPGDVYAILRLIDLARLVRDGEG